MPPRFSYWTILIGGTPTAFRSARRDELIPTLCQLRSTQPDAELVYFARGRLWASQEAAREAFRKRATEKTNRSPKARDGDWRPGGDHRDPRARFGRTSRGRRRSPRPAKRR